MCVCSYTKKPHQHIFSHALTRGCYVCFFKAAKMHKNDNAHFIIFFLNMFWGSLYDFLLLIFSFLKGFLPKFYKTQYDIDTVDNFIIFLSKIFSFGFGF